VLITLIYNPTAGDEDHDGSELRTALEGAGHAVRATSVKDEGWQALLADPGDLVVAAGGDGTVRKVFKELATSDVDVTVLPLGSANNIATTLGLAEAGVDELLSGLDDAERRRYDLVEASAPWGRTLLVESFGGGLFADVLARAEEVDTNDADKVEVGLQVLEGVLLDLPALDWEVEVDGIDASGSYLAVETMNIGQTGANIPLAPQADPGDGRLDLVQIRPEDRVPLLDYVRARLRGEGPEAPPLRVLLGSRVSLRPPVGCRLRVDDELWPEDGAVPGGDRLTVATGNLAVRLLVPAQRRR
jgi:diacylglycerol kinase (ATP)